MVLPLSKNITFRLIGSPKSVLRCEGVCSVMCAVALWRTDDVSRLFTTSRLTTACLILSSSPWWILFNICCYDSHILAWNALWTLTDFSRFLDFFFLTSFSSCVQYSLNVSSCYCFLHVHGYFIFLLQIFSQSVSAFPIDAVRLIVLDVSNFHCACLFLLILQQAVGPGIKQLLCCWAAPPSPVGRLRMGIAAHLNKKDNMLVHFIPSVKRLTVVNSDKGGRPNFFVFFPLGF